ncbi:hypothetical protein R6Q57_030055 [Mikania cordata]
MAKPEGLLESTGQRGSRQSADVTSASAEGGKTEVRQSADGRRCSTQAEGGGRCRLQAVVDAGGRRWSTQVAGDGAVVGASRRQAMV